MEEGEGGEEKGRPFLSFSSLPFLLPSFPFSPETPDTQATFYIFTDSLKKFSLVLLQMTNYIFSP